MAILDLFQLTPLPKKIKDNFTEKEIGILQTHEAIKKDGRHNFEGLQIPVKSKLNHEKLYQYLTDYWD